ncbi:Class E vacuolar protein-sorting machinery protein hse1 [Sphaceloma murrayae]|uniref:Class E vacuolar protein-sorting machinery protein hse1 n=1 Tax=Sphaceloma murrayae TaxID=2082308 RepID=A0A2K1QWQ6_9PEZI|nr:Class E vacuolar protein-sorting machinery protein hse1 [Sphaceloma murrayae]
MALKSLLCLDTESPHPPSPPAVNSSSPPPMTASNFSHISTTIKINPPSNATASPPLHSESAALNASSAGINEIVRVPSILRMRTKLLPHVPNPEAFAPLLLPCDCDICHRAIPSSSPRYHCYQCSGGDYDVCLACYSTLASTHRIAPENGAGGWRRCPKGHRMVVIGFEERERGLRRVVLRDLVGGWALKEDDVAGPLASASALASSRSSGGGGGSSSTDHVVARERAGWRWREQDGREQLAPFRHGDLVVINVQAHPAFRSQESQHEQSQGQGQNQSQNQGQDKGQGQAQAQTQPQDQGVTKGSGPALMLPPDGGVGLKVQALWSYFPAEGVGDELAFPKGSEIREVEDINGDWYWGVFAGRKGLFPGNHGRVIGY